MSSKQLCKSLTVIIPVCERAETTAALFPEYQADCKKLCEKAEFIVVVNTDFPEVVTAFEEIQENDSSVSVIVLNRNYGEATAVSAAVEQAKGELILTLPPYKQVETSELPVLFEHIESCDIVLAARSSRQDNTTMKWQTRTFSYLINRLADQRYSDIGCGVRLIKAHVLKELNIYGDHWRFMPLLAYQIGYISQEAPITQADDDAKYSKIYRPGIYVRRILDLLSIVFLTKFNKKPLRFFGLIGSGSIAIGLVGLLYVAFQRLFFDMPLADRPILVLFSIFFVLGCQLIAIGLVGETIIFTHAKDNKEYRIKKIFHGGQ